MVVDAVYPPIRVKSDFLDVANARADYERYLEAARSYAEQKQSAALSAARQVTDAAETFRQQALSDAQGSAHALSGMIAEIQSGDDPSAARRVQSHSLWLESLQKMFAKTKRKIIAGTDPDADLFLPVKAEQ